MDITNTMSWQFKLIQSTTKCLPYMELLCRKKEKFEDDKEIIRSSKSKGQKEKQWYTKKLKEN